MKLLHIFSEAYFFLFGPRPMVRFIVDLINKRPDLWTFTPETEDQLPSYTTLNNRFMISLTRKYKMQLMSPMSLLLSKKEQAAIEGAFQLMIIGNEISTIVTQKKQAKEITTQAIRDAQKQNKLLPGKESEAD